MILDVPIEVVLVGGLFRFSEPPKPKGKYQKHFFFQYQGSWHYPHVSCSYVVKIKPPINGMAEYER